MCRPNIFWSVMLMTVLLFAGLAPVDAASRKRGQQDQNAVRPTSEARVKAAGDERRVALVIGNAAYADSPLKNPANDATDMAAALKQIGFEGILLTNADLRKMKDATEEFSKQLRRSDVGLFY